MKNSGMFWHEYHNLLATYCSNYKERIKTIENHKPPNERPIRKRLFWPVKGKLPKEFAEAERKYVKADGGDGAKQKLEDASRKYKKEIESLHKKECPDCPWNGKTIFPRKKQ